MTVGGCFAATSNRSVQKESSTCITAFTIALSRPSLSCRRCLRVVICDRSRAAGPDADPMPIGVPHARRQRTSTATSSGGAG
jgi:hypothetical protein